MIPVRRPQRPTRQTAVSVGPAPGKGHRGRRETAARWHGWWRADTGSVAAEITLVAPFLIALLVFVAVVIGRGVDARLRLDDAAHQAARAASLARTAPAAASAARVTATTALAGAGVNCQSVQVDTSGQFGPGGRVTVTLACSVNVAAASLLAVPTSRTLQATATEPIDVYRGSG